MSCSNQNDADKQSKMMYLDFVFLKSKERKLMEENAALKKRLEKRQVQAGANQNSSKVYDDKNGIKAKRIRKTKDEVVRDFKCSVQSCGKAYG